MSSLNHTALRLDVDGTTAELHLSGDWPNQVRQIQAAIGGGAERLAWFHEFADAYVHDSGACLDDVPLNPYATLMCTRVAAPIYGPVVIVERRLRQE